MCPTVLVAASACADLAVPLRANLFFSVSLGDLCGPDFLIVIYNEGWRGYRGYLEARVSPGELRPGLTVEVGVAAPHHSSLQKQAHIR